MALTIMLEGNFDYDALYNFISKQDSFKRVSEPKEQRFSFHLKNVKDVFYQVYPTGKIRIDTDDYSDSYVLVQIIVDAACLSSKRNLTVKILSLKPLPSAYQRIGAASIQAFLLGKNHDNTNEWQALVVAEAARIKRVHDAIQTLALPEQGEGCLIGSPRTQPGRSPQ